MQGEEGTVVLARDSGEAEWREASELQLANSLRAEKSHDTMKTPGHRNGNLDGRVLQLVKPA